MLLIAHSMAVIPFSSCEFLSVMVKLALRKIKDNNIWCTTRHCANSAEQGMVVGLPHNTDEVCDTHKHYYTRVLLYLQ